MNTVTDLQHHGAINWPLVKLMIKKDWFLFQKQFAAYMLATLVSLLLLGHPKLWSFYIGTLLLFIIMVAVACFSISNALINERREQTLAFMMSFPLSPLDFYLSKLLGNLLTFLVPFALIIIGAVSVILFAPQIPDGLLVFTVLLFGHIFLAYSVSLSVAMAVESEGWNIFVMIASMVLINPMIMILGQIPSISSHTKGEVMVWSTAAVLIFSGQLLISFITLVMTGWVHCRKKAFY